MKNYSLIIIIAFGLVTAVPSSAQQAHVLYDQYINAVNSKNKAAALTRAAPLIAAAKKQFSPQSDSVFQYLMMVGYGFYSNNYIEECIPWYQEALVLRKQLAGEDDRYYQELLDGLALACFTAQKFDDAAPLYETIMNYRGKKYGHTDSMYISGVFMYANAQQYQGKKQEAIEKYHRVNKWFNDRKIRTTDRVNLLLWLGQALYEINDIAAAESKWTEARDLCTEIAPQDTMYYKSIHFLALAYIELGLTRKAEEYYKVLLPYYKGRQGKEQDYATSLSEISAVYLTSGRYVQAEEVLKESLVLRKRYNAPPDKIANSYNELANLYMALGNLAQAEISIREAIALREKYHGKDKVYAIYLHNLAIIHNNRGDFDKALPLEKETSDIYGKYNDNDAGYMQSLANVSYDLYNLGRIKEAEEYLRLATAVSKKMPKDHPYIYELYMLEGIFSQERKDYRKAAEWYEKGHLLFIRLYGPQHTEGSAMNRLSKLYLLTGNYQKAYEWQQKKNELLKRKVAKGMEFLSETELVSLSASSNFTDAPAMIAHQGASLQAAAMLYDNLLFIKGLALNNNTAVANAILSSGDSTLIKLWSRTNELKRMIYEQEQLVKERRSYNVDSLTQLATDNEKMLVKRSQLAGEKNAFANASWKDVQNKLDNKSCAIEFVRYKHTDVKKDSTYYGALVVTRSSAAPVFVKLCNEDTLRSLLNRYSKNGGELYQRGLTITSKTTINFTKALYDLVWKPVEQHLAGIEQVYFSPDGLLHRISFAALPVNDSLMLLQKYRLSPLFSTRDAGTKGPAVKPKNILLAGGIDYNSGTLQTTGSSGNPLSFVYRNSEMAEFSYLPGTLDEVSRLTAVCKEFGVAQHSLTGTAATETAFRSLSGHAPSVVHISTHGFSLPDGQQKDNMNNSFVAASDPLVRCGLVMAGGNTAWKSKQAGNSFDGILTGKEISTINLRGCELAVLSACETGLGNIQGTEGVFGLQRALKTAGVRSVIVSLWSVPDKETVEFMELFYTQWFKTGDKESAFRNAQLDMQQKYKPALWAAFVLIQ